ncbi:MAG: PEP-CTERM sorting domain-containing protein, partial [Planctomycetota bacterium]|nr:PEP-CTERM sorting domain-containing protein [Planctomycetota bacterium]
TGDEWREGDFNGSGSVNDSDLNLLLSNWTYPPSASAVPEPATLLLLVSAGTVLLRRRRKL